MDDDESLSELKPWFEPKRFGYGAGLPIVWQGWVLMGAFIVAVIGLMLIFRFLAGIGSVLAAVPMAALIFSVLWFVRLCERHTRGGWRWRWGGKD